METKKKNEEKLVEVPQSVLLSLVANKLKDKILFPNKVKNAKAYLKQVKISEL